MGSRHRGGGGGGTEIEAVDGERAGVMLVDGVFL